MMKMNSKIIMASLIALMLNLSLVGNVLAFGAVNTLMQAKEKAQGFKEEAASQGICLRIDEISGKIKQRMDQREEQLEKRIEERKQNMEKNRRERNENLTKFRIEADKWRNKSYQLLEEKALTDEQKTAVKKFEEAVEAAVKVRREAIDLAIDDFHNGVDQAIISHLEDIQKTRNVYRETVRTALEKAKTDCESGVDSKIIRTNLHNSLKAARGQLREDKAGITKFNSTMQTLITAKKIAFEKAISDFKTALEAARTELKKYFSENED